MLISLLPIGWRPYAKAIIAALLPVVLLVIVSLLTHQWDQVALAGALVGSLGAIATIVTRALPTFKTLITALVVLLGLVITGLLTNVWDSNALGGAIVSVLSALLIYQAPNDGPAPVDAHTIGLANDTLLPRTPERSGMD